MADQPPDTPKEIDLLTGSELAESVVANVMEGEWGARGELWVLGQGVLIGSVIAAPDLPGLPLLSRVVGLAVIVAGAAIAVVGAADLGTSLSPWPVPVEGNRLRTDGVYALCRHPIYTGFLLGSGGLGLLTASPERLLLSFTLLVFLSGKASREEEDLEEKHGADYTAWAASVPRFFPTIATLRGLLS